MFLGMSRGEPSHKITSPAKAAGLKSARGLLAKPAQQQWRAIGAYRLVCTRVGLNPAAAMASTI